MKRPTSLSVLKLAAIALALVTTFTLSVKSPGQDATDDLQACCLPDGTCVNENLESCYALGGVPQGEGTACESGECPQPTVACCLPDGTCVNEDLESCYALGGAPQGEGTTCDGSDCSQPTVACCFSDGSCLDLDAESCLSEGGDPQADGSDCASTDCPQPTVACCFSDGSCSDLDVASCLSEGGDPQAEGSDCGSVSCAQPTVACCFSDGSCQDLDIGMCWDMGGVPHAEGSNCAGTDCPQPTVACCFPDGGCSDLDVESCISEGGDPQAEGSDCGSVSCAQPTVACCFSDGSCQDLEVSVCRNADGVSQGTGTCCIRSACPQPEVSGPSLLPIRLISPLPGDGLGIPSGAVQFCWEGLEIPGLIYQVFNHTKQCDPDVINGPHPFAPMIPDPALSARRPELLAHRDWLSARLRYLEDYCDNISEMFGQSEERLSEIPGDLARLEEGRTRADDAQAGSFVMPLPTCCPQPAEGLLAPYAARLDAIPADPCEDPAACRGLASNLLRIVDRIQSLLAHGFVQSLEFDRLLTRWENQADHRGVMEVYHDIFSFVDGAISFITDLADLLTPELETMVQKMIEEHLTDVACKRSPAVCAAIDSAVSAADKLSTIAGIMKNAKPGTPPPAFIVVMVQAMAQSAAAATGVAVEGWANFADYMSAVLWDAYETLLCEEQALQWLLDRRTQIEALCEACQHCLRDELTTIDAELEGIAAREQAATAARQAYWGEQLGIISSQISQVGAHLDDAWYDACCSGPASQTIEIPSESLIAQQLEEAIKKALGDKACFLTFSCTIECEYKDGQVVGATVSCEHGFPLAERRHCCCVPCERQQSPLGSPTAPTRPGGTICQPPSGGVVSPEPGSWGVEARDESGTLVASSPRRELGRGATTEPARLRPVPAGCLCSVSASVNGILLPLGGVTVAMQQGVQANISAAGGCGPNCAAGTQSISIQPPTVAPILFGVPVIVMPPAPISVMAPSTAYDFPIEGVYAITVTQFCEDGQECSYTFAVNASGPASPVPRQPNAGETELDTCPSCGNDECIELAYQHGQEPPLTPLVGHTLALTAPSTLDLEATSSCRLDCAGERNVRWEMTDPNGNLEIFEDVDLYRISYVFGQNGQYSLCVIESVPCPEGELRFEDWWIFEVASPG